MTDTKSPKPSGGGPVFFLSYARPSAAERVQGDPDRDFAAFYYDLCAALTRFAPLDRLHSLGAVSAEWHSTGGGAGNDPAKDIAECDVFVPLHQERYFQSDQCGRELAGFEARVRRAATPEPTRSCRSCGRRCHRSGRRPSPRRTVPDTRRSTRNTSSGACSGYRARAPRSTSTS